MPDNFVSKSDDDASDQRTAAGAGNGDMRGTAHSTTVDDGAGKPAAAHSAGAGNGDGTQDAAVASGRRDGGGSRHGRKNQGGRDGSAGRSSWGWLRELVMIVVVALVLSFLIKTFLFRAFYIPSGSMEDTLQINDRIFVNLLVPEPMSIERGDVVVFQDTKGWLPPAPEQPAGVQSWLNEALVFVGLVPDDSEQHLVKRVIGLPGDNVVCCDADGRVTINGEPIEEPYLYPGAAPSDTPFDVVVPEGMLWVMGDHRNASSDSREHQRVSGDGFVSIDDVDGEAVITAWPLNRISLLGGYGEVFEDVPEPSEAAAARPAPAGTR